MIHTLRSLPVVLLILAEIIAAAAPARGAEEKPAPEQKTAEKAPPGKGSRRPSPAMTKNVTAPSCVLQRGELDILTYETEQGCDRLQELFHESQGAALTPGELTTRHYRSSIDNSVQP